ncbi:MAG: hypothetical protein LBH53_03305 [Puniceicoccales bacterium]|jgi:hypothetical protein|nr:hypothetical protein [Puniceicoccales bacterium]
MSEVFDRRGFTLLELLLLLALVTFFSAGALRSRHGGGEFRRTAELLRSYLQSVVEQVQFRDPGHFFLLIGSSSEDSGELRELLLAEGDGRPEVATNFHLRLQNFGSIALPDTKMGSDFGAAVPFGPLADFPGLWYAIPASRLLEEEGLGIVLRSPDRVPSIRRFSLSRHGTVLVETP